MKNKIQPPNKHSRQAALSGQPAAMQTAEIPIKLVPLTSKVYPTFRFTGVNKSIPQKLVKFNAGLGWLNFFCFWIYPV